MMISNVILWFILVTLVIIGLYLVDAIELLRKTHTILNKRNKND